MVVSSSGSAHTRAVIVVGSGLAGLSAAAAALRANAPSVVLLERAAKPGGNSIKASSGINGAPTRFQRSNGPPDTAFYADTIKSAGQRLTQSVAERPRREALIALLTNSSAAAVESLVDDVGVDLSVVAQLGGHSVARTHRGAGKTPPGADIIMKMLQKLKSDNRFELRTGCEVTRLLSTEAEAESTATAASRSSVVGLQYRSAAAEDQQTVSLHGPVVFATGGFAGDADGMLAQYRPDLAGLPSTNDPRPGMHSLLTAVGAQLVDMDSVQIHPTGFVDPAHPTAPLKFLAAEMLRGEGAILLRNGRRFVNELETRAHVSGVIMEGPRQSAGSSDNGSDMPRQWDIQILLDPGACDAAASHVSFYVWKGLLAKKKISELDVTTRATIKQYSSVVAGVEKDEFGRQSFGHWKLRGLPDEEDAEVCIGHVTPITHFTMGGVAIDASARVLSSPLSSEKQASIDGLWAAGEVTGGIHGDNRLGGSSLLECVVLGSIAGKQAALALKGE